MTDKTILTPVVPQVREYKHEFSEILTIDDVFTPEECHGIIHDFGEDLDGAKLIEPGPLSFPLMDKLLDVAMMANERYEFEVDHFEGVAISCFNPGEGADWGKGLGTGRAANRKMCLVVQLSSQGSYSGGNLQIVTDSDSPFSAERRQGSVIVFPSWEQHRVAVVSEGERWSLTAWASGGNRFR